MEELSLIKVSMEYAEQIAEYRQELLDTGSSMDGTGMLRAIEDPQEYVKLSLEYEKNPPEGFVPATQLLLIRNSDSKVVGMIQVRHSFNEYLEKYAGHIGYCVRPSQRRNGYGRLMLKMALPFCRKIGIDKVLISCAVDNIGSERIILANGGVYESTVVEPRRNRELKRYIISLDSL